MKKIIGVLIFLLAIPGTAKDKTVDKTGKKGSVVDDLLGEEVSKEASDWGKVVQVKKHSYPYVEHHGYFRIRADGIYRGHLGTNTLVQGKTISTSGLLPPLTDNGANTNSPNKSAVGPQGEAWIGGVNIRFRYIPTFHISSGLRIKGEFDVLDNMILGSTPDYDPTRPDAPLAIMSRGQAPVNSLTNSLRDPIAVKQAFMEWDIIGGQNSNTLLRFSGGRMAENFGLGMVYNSGEGMDDDFGTYVDRLQLMFATGRWFVKGAFGWASSGPSSASPKWSLGQPHDLTDKDDCLEGVLAFGYAARTDRAKEADRQRMVVMNKPVVDTALHLNYRSQNLAVAQQSLDAIKTGKIDPSKPGTKGYDAIKLVQRGAWTLVPDLWFRLRYKPDYKKLLRVEFEVASVLGKINHMDPGKSDYSMSIRSFGAALETQFTTGSISFGMNAGVASGDDSPYFGVLDAPKVDKAGSNFSAFYFNPDYRVDNLMYRYVIGTITDSMYFDPFFIYDAFEKEEDALGARVDLVYGRAIYSSSTPSGDPNLGVELRLKAFYKASDMFFADLEWDVLWPLAAFDLKQGYMNSAQSKASHWSTILRARLGVRF